MRHTDKFLINVWHCLSEDFSEIVGSDVSSDLIIQGYRGNYRELPSRGCFLSPPHWLKYRIQLEKFFSRWTFESEVDLASDRRDRCFQKFLGIQQRYQGQLTYRSSLVISKAREYCKAILRDYSLDEHISLCSFSNNATTLSPKSKSDPDQKLYGPISGSMDHIAWFKEYVLPQDTLLSSICSIEQLTAVDKLGYTTVSKKWDIDRGIMPNTTIGSFYSSGLGKMIRLRLKTARESVYESLGVKGVSSINLRHASSTHRELARENSISRKLVTADLSSASDCFTTSLVNRLVPRKWFNVLKFGRLNKFEFNGNQFHLNSFMTMGIGFTFELQSLLFYCILLAIKELSRTKGRISVYGDDLIYPTPMHRFVEQVFNDLQFSLNKEKTFVQETFRESCGGDFYCGLPVRPVQPEGTGTTLSSVSFQALLYVTLNRLIEVHGEETIPRTVNYILNCLFLESGTVFQVPPDYPEYSGFRVTSLRSDLWYEFPIVHDFYTLQIKCLCVLHKGRRVPKGRQGPYLWCWLQQANLTLELQRFDPWCDNNPPRLRLRKRSKVLPNGRKVYWWDTFAVRRDFNYTLQTKNISRDW